jgi:hypothetical protein
MAPLLSGDRGARSERSRIRNTAIVTGGQPAAQALEILSRRALMELGALQKNLDELRGQRNAALRRFLVSRYAATAIAQREFWLEFAWLNQEYRAAVRRLARFCRQYREGSPRTLRRA